jgi:hypothetical protein
MLADAFARVAPASRLAGPLRSQDRPRINVPRTGFCLKLALMGQRPRKKGRSKLRFSCYSAAGGRNQNEALWVLRAFQALTQSTLSVSVTSVLKLF